MEKGKYLLLKSLDNAEGGGGQEGEDEDDDEPRQEEIDRIIFEDSTVRDSGLSLFERLKRQIPSL